MKSWLFRWLFPWERCAMLSQAREEMALKYEQKFRTLQRSPLDESVWVRKFAALDSDYAALEKEIGELRVENWSLKLQLRKLLS
jgi:hypothetical protein